jgi:hypothetical protein
MEMYKSTAPCSGFVNSLRGQTVTMTGKVIVRGEHVKRDDLARIVQAQGATFKNYLTGKVSLLVHGDLTSQIMANMNLQFSDKLLDVVNKDRRHHHVFVVNSTGISELLRGEAAKCLHDAVANRIAGR